MNTNRSDVFWNYIATFFKISSSALLLPFILHALPSEDVGIWSIFSTVSALVFLIDFGFNSSFSRNVTYVFSGVSELHKEGHAKIDKNFNHLDYNLLKGIIKSMRWFYLRVSILLFVLLGTIGTWYISGILKEYNGNTSRIYVSWFLFIAINTYNLYTLYYDALLEGKGLIKVSKQITILGHLIYLVVSVIFIYWGLGITALVLAQLSSIVIIRSISHRKFFTSELNSQLLSCSGTDTSVVLKAIYPNALKYGVTSLGGFMIQKSSIFIGSMYLSLPAIASFAITKQIMDVLVAVANISITTYLPRIARLRVSNDIESIRQIYVKGIVVSNCIFLVGTLIMILLGPIVLQVIKSNTFIDPKILVAIGASSLIGLNAGVSGAVLSTKNTIPFMKPSLVSGIATMILLAAFFEVADFGLMGMALAPGIIDLCYQGWKWPLEVTRDLNLRLNDFYRNLKINR